MCLTNIKEESPSKTEISKQISFGIKDLFVIIKIRERIALLQLSSSDKGGKTFLTYSVRLITEEIPNE